MISDQNHNAGTNGFYFLLKGGARPTTFATFAPAANPTVRIDQVTLSPAGCTTDCTATVVRANVATFTMTSGPEGQVIKVHTGGDAYDCEDDAEDQPFPFFVTHWDSSDFGVAINGIYRMRVSVPSNGGQLELGYADIEIAANRKAFKRIDQTEFLPLVLDRTLKIRFRIETPALACANVVCQALDQCHAAGECAPQVGKCSNPTLANGTVCNDGNPNTVGDACTAGVCAGVDHCLGVTCVAQDQCHAAGVCVDHATGACSNPTLANGTVCNDGNPNTVGDVCTAGVCAGVDHCSGVTCVAQDQCHAAGVCVDHATGACSNPTLANGTVCNDGNACTVTDTCTAGVCGGTGTPCQNGATCSSSGSAAVCACTTGWTGPTCATVADFCISNPCKNGGTCTSGSSSYTCACAGGFNGPTCEGIAPACKLVNGDFESPGGTVLSGAYSSTPGWINLSPSPIQASTVAATYEGGYSVVDRTQVLRLVADSNPSSSADYRGAIAQQFAPAMQTGRTYVMTATAMDFAIPNSVPYAATMSFTSAASLTANVYAHQDVVLSPNEFRPNAFSLSYTATAADAGKPLFVLLQAPQLTGVQFTRGALDDVRVTCARPPVAAFCGCTGTYGISAPITFDGSCSSAPDFTGKITSWDWDLTYNGLSFNQTIDALGFGVTGKVVTKQFASYTQDYAGNPLAGAAPQVVALRVTDDTPPILGGPLTSIATCNVITKPPPHCPHVSAGGPYAAAVGQAINFDASASFDLDHDPVTYQWDFDGSGTFTGASGVTAAHAFGAAGSYRIAVRGTDHPALNPDPTIYSAGVAADCPVVAYGSVEVGNPNPVSVAGGPYFQETGRSVQLDGSGSSDPSGLPLTYGWDFTGDGQFKDSAVARPIYSPGNLPAGSVYSVCLRVSNGKQSAVSCANVRVIAQRVPPVCALLASTVSTTCNGSAFTVTGDGSRSYSGNLDNAPLVYKWTTDCPATFDAPTSAITHLNFSASSPLTCARACTATLTLTDFYIPSLVTSCPMTISVRTGP